MEIVCPVCNDEEVGTALWYRATFDISLNCYFTYLLANSDKALPKFVPI